MPQSKGGVWEMLCRNRQKRSPSLQVPPYASLTSGRHAGGNAKPILLSPCEQLLIMSTV